MCGPVERTFPLATQRMKRISPIFPDKSTSRRSWHVLKYRRCVFTAILMPVRWARSAIRRACGMSSAIGFSTAMARTPYSAASAIGCSRIFGAVTMWSRSGFSRASISSRLVYRFGMPNRSP